MSSCKSLCGPDPLEIKQRRNLSSLTPRIIQLQFPGDVRSALHSLLLLIWEERTPATLLNRMSCRKLGRNVDRILITFIASLKDCWLVSLSISLRKSGGNAARGSPPDLTVDSLTLGRLTYILTSLRLTPREDKGGG